MWDWKRLCCRHPSLPTLEMRNGSYVPMELVDVEPVRVKKITDEQRALVCRFSTTKPTLHQKSIESIRHDSGKQCFEKDPFVAAWNLNVDVEMIRIPARTLPMPEIVYNKYHRVTSKSAMSSGFWDLKTVEFRRPANFPDVWAMINMAPIDQQACEKFYHQLSVISNQRGMRCCPPVIYEEHPMENFSTEQIVNIVRKIMDRNVDCKLLLVVLPEDKRTRTHIYNELKKLVRGWKENSVITSNLIV